MTTHPEHDEGLQKQLLNYFSDGVPSYDAANEAVKSRARQIVSDIMPVIAAHTAKEVEAAEVLLRHKIASQAPDCTHSLSSEKEHKAWCGFANSIWTHWAVKNGAGIVNGKPYRATPALKERKPNEQES